MSKTTSRRAVLAGAATLPALSLPALAGPHPDARLLALRALWDAEGVALKARALLWEVDCSHDLAGAEHVVETQTRYGGVEIHPEWFLSLVRDVLALAGTVEARS